VFKKWRSSFWDSRSYTMIAFLPESSFTLPVAELRAPESSTSESQAILKIVIKFTAYQSEYYHPSFSLLLHQWRTWIIPIPPVLWDLLQFLMALHSGLWRDIILNSSTPVTEYKAIVALCCGISTMATAETLFRNTIGIFSPPVVSRSIR